MTGGSFILFEIIFRNYFFTHRCLVCEVLVKANSQERTRDIPQVSIAFTLKGHDGIITALTGTAMKINRSIPWNLIHSLPQLT